MSETTNFNRASLDRYQCTRLAFHPYIYTHTVSYEYIPTLDQRAEQIQSRSSLLHVPGRQPRRANGLTEHPPHPRHMGLGLVWLEQVFRWWDTARWLPMELSSSFTEHMYTYVSLGDTQRCWLIHTLAINSWRSVLSNIVTLKHRSYTDIGGHLPFRYGDVITPSIIISYSAG